jgi:hypothetical protein
MKKLMKPLKRKEDFLEPIFRSFCVECIFQGNKIASIGFGSSFDRSLTPDNKAIEEEILKVIEKYEGKTERTLLSSDQYLNQIDVTKNRKR